MSMTYKKITISCLLLGILLLLLSACGKNEQPDGIDSITVLSPERTEETAAPVEAEETSGIRLEDALDRPLVRYDGRNYSSSLYLLFLQEALNMVAERYEVTPEEAMAVDVLLEDGSVLPAEEYCRQVADTEFRWVCLLVSSLDGIGTDASQTDSWESASKAAYAVYQSELPLYTKLQISLDDLILFYQYTDLYEDLFRLRYGPDGDRTVSPEILSELMEENVRKIRYTYLPFYDDLTQDPLSEEEIRARTALSEEYLERFLNGEPFEDIVRENYVFLDSYNLFFDPEVTEIYYSVYEPQLSSAIVAAAEKLEPGSAEMIVSDDFTSVVQRLPVNEKQDGRWFHQALSLAFESPYGEEYAEELTLAYDSLPLEFDEELLEVLNVENLVSFLNGDDMQKDPE